MGKSQETFNKKEKEKKRLKKRKEKLEKREERKVAKSESDATLENMMAYVDEEGNIVDTPPDPTKKKKFDAKSIDIGVPRSVDVEVDPIKKGRVEFFNDSKGFGFIRETENKERHFVHANGLLEDIEENDMVSFELERGLKGMNAVRVKKIKAGE